MLGSSGSWFSWNPEKEPIGERDGNGVETLTNYAANASVGGAIVDEPTAFIEATAKSEDEMVDRLLTQFPAYGSRVSHNPAPEWFNTIDLTGYAGLKPAEETKQSAPVLPPRKETKPEKVLIPSEEWDLDEQNLWKTEPAAVADPTPPEPSSSTPRHTRRKSYMAAVAPPPETVFTPPRPSPMPGELQTTSPLPKLEDRQHWMPDQLCKQCYACDMPFTVFRRRHHCRLCGQVFCASCSAYFVPMGDLTIRVCQMCNDQVANRGGVVDRADKPVLGETASPEVERQKRLTDQILEGADPSSALLTSLGQRPLLSTARPEVLLELEEKDRLAAEAQLGHHPLRSSVKALPSAATAVTSAPPSKPLKRQLSSLSASATVVSADDGGAMLASRPSSAADMVREGNRHLGMAAAEHMEIMAEELLRLHAPLLFDNLDADSKSDWINKLLSLATRSCATVDPNVKKGDLLDIRPYCKVKVIPGGSIFDSVYISGVMFRKTVSHKQMAREIESPHIMLLSGGIEFTRIENRIASLETLFEQEDKYMEILVGKILKHKPDVLLVGRSVSRRAQELFLKAGVVLIQHVKSSLLSRISRQTGATVISSTDHVMSQFGPSVLGKCHRFRLATFRDNETWIESTSVDDMASGTKRSIQALLSNPELSNPERQAALAANKLGEGVLDGSEAVKTGLAKRGVAQTYVMLEGCQKHLGCTVVLRGAKRAALKQVKVVLRFLINVAYNLRLETSYLRERGARIRPDFKADKKYAFSSSLCVDYGQPGGGKKVRPWNGGSSESLPRLESGEITAFDHQSILITSVWMTEKTQCCPAEVKGICYYSLQDVSLGQFLRDSCFNLSLRCQNPNCKKSVLDHSLSFVHKDGLINITVRTPRSDGNLYSLLTNRSLLFFQVEELDEDLPPSPLDRLDGDATTEEKVASRDDELDKPIATWTYCRQCRKVVTPLVYISESTWKFSFGKFLEVFFYNRDAIMNAPEHNCSCQTQSNTWLYFGCGRLAARFNYEPVRPFDVFVRRTLPMVASFHREEAMRRLELVSGASAKLFVKFDKHIERVSREARSLFNSPFNRPEHLQTVLSELNQMLSDVDHVAKTLQEKIASASDSLRKQTDDEVLNEALFRFPWFARRYLFMLTSSWNEKLSAIAHAITAMKKLAASSSTRSDGVIGQNVAIGGGDPLNEALVESMRALRKLNEQYSKYSVTDITDVLPSLPGSNDLQQDGDGDYDDEFDDPETSIDFADGVDADVLASRRRLQSKSSSSTPSSSRPRPTMSLGTRRLDSSRTDSVSAPPKPTPGGAVKSAITRFFNRGGREYDPYTVDLGVFAEGRPRLSPGVNGVVVPVYDEHFSTIIAYSLASSEYAKQFKHFSRTIPPIMEIDTSGPPPLPRSRTTSLDQSERSGEMRSASEQQPKAGPSPSASGAAMPDTDEIREMKDIERRMLVRSKSHIKHTFRDFDEKGQVTCKFVCTTYWATQFHAVRQVFLSRNSGKSDSPEADPNEVEQGYVESLSAADLWDASGGKSGASFAKTSDSRFIIKCISRTELQMFLDCAPAYFEYLSKAFFHGL